jgi:hypothetical protein
MIEECTHMRTQKLSAGFRYASSIMLLLGLLLAGRGVNAQAPPSNPAPVVGTTDWDQWKINCSLTSDFLKKLFSCGSSTFRSRPFHFVVQSIVPGSAVGGGGRYTADLNQSNGTQAQLQATALITIREFWLAELKYTSQHHIVKDWNPSGEDLGLTVWARNRSMPVLTYYGLGPNTQLNDAAKFSERDTSAGIEITTPFPGVSWLSAGGKIEGLWPSVGGVSGANIISIQQEYNEQTAPGLTTQPFTMHEQIYLRPHKRYLERFQIDANVGYNFFEDTSTGHYSFHRFESTVQQRFYPEKKKHGGVIEQNYFSVLWKYSVSQASAGNAVPFYLQETLGGTDIDNQPSLRAFHDYRFRGPDLMMVQAEYDRKLCDECAPCKQGTIRAVCTHLGLVLAYDAGKVALRNSDLDFSGMRQSFGGGIAIYLGKDVVFRMAVALGGGEGVHPYFGVANFL